MVPLLCQANTTKAMQSVAAKDVTEIGQAGLLIFYCLATREGRWLRSLTNSLNCLFATELSGFGHRCLDGASSELL